MISVLYAEDDPQIAQMMRVFFEDYAPDCTLDTVDNGRSCLERVGTHHYDVLIVDLMMPELDGLQVLGELAARRNPTPVIMVSGYGQTELAVRALRAGAIDCIDKNSPEFRRVPEIVRRVHAQQQAKLPATPAASAPVGAARILYLDASAITRASTAQFFQDHAPALNLVTTSPTTLDDRLDCEPAYDALVIGPELGGAHAVDLLRKARSRASELPVIILASAAAGADAIAAFKLGAHDYLVEKEGVLLDLVFSLNNALKRTTAERHSSRLGRELAELNRSLEAQVKARTTELAALSHRLIRIQEDERRHIALELHDQIGQMLTGLRFLLEAAQTAQLPAEKITQSIQLTDETIHYVRDLTQQLRPRVLDDLGLQPAIEWHLRQYHRQTSITVASDITLTAGRLPGELETTIFRMVQEALTNIARHANCTSASLLIDASGEQIFVEISDQGCGFEPARLREVRESLGLAGLEERVHLAGGKFEIHSMPGVGTRLSAEFPQPALAPVLTP